MLITITANLLAETTAYYSSQETGKTHRASELSFQVGGKGINASKMANKLGWDTTAFYFPGGHTGKRCTDWLKQQDFASQPIAVTDETRSGWVCRTLRESSKDFVETTYLGKDSPLQVCAWERAFAKLNSLDENQVIAICGSIPGWNEAFIKAISPLFKKHFLAIDTYGPALKACATLPFDLIKINRQELEQLAPENASLATPDLLLEISKASPTKRWVISNGPNSIWAFEKSSNNQPFEIAIRSVEESSSVGCGDVLFAALLHSLCEQKHSLEAALRYAIPYASANAASPGIAEFAVDKISPLND